MKTLYWDMINPFTGRPFTFGDPNLRWGDPSYYLEPGDPGFVPYPDPDTGPMKKPFHHASKKSLPTSTNNSITPMSTFNYNVAPKSGGGFTTRPVLGAEFSDEFIDGLVATATGLTPTQCASVLGAYFGKFLECASGCGWSHNVHGLFSVRPTCGGSQSMPDGFNNAAEINAGVSIAIYPTQLDAWRTGLSIHSMGQVGPLTPTVDSIMNLANNTQDTHTGGEILQANGSNLDFDKTDSAQGMFYSTAAAPGVKVRINVYGTITFAQINAVMPAGVTGPLTIYVVNEISGTLRTGVYANPVA